MDNQSSDQLISPQTPPVQPEPEAVDAENARGGLSGRRKLAAVIVAVVTAALMMDSRTQDSDSASDVSQSLEQMDELESFLVDFETPTVSQPESTPEISSGDSPSEFSLTIPDMSDQTTASHNNTAVAAYPPSVPHAQDVQSSPDVETASPAPNRRVIRLTGTIQPVM
jgi:hypothetical protein